MASANHPGKNVKEGAWTYKADFWVHRNVGPNDDAVVCLAKTYGKPCPICEEYKRAVDAYGFDDSRAKALKSSHQCLYNVKVYDTPDDEKKGVQVWQVAHFFFEKNIVELAKSPRKGGTDITFSDPDIGKSISFFRKGKENVSFSGFQFVDRDVAISDEDLESVYCLEELVHVLTYEEVHELFYGSFSPNSPVNPPPTSAEPSPGRSRERGARSEPGPECKDGFGNSIDEIPECANCQVYESCADEFDRLQAEQERVSPRPYEDSGRGSSEKPAPAPVNNVPVVEPSSSGEIYSRSRATTPMKEAPLPPAPSAGVRRRRA
jgi:hypothetical protein